MTRERDRIQENANKFIVKNCPSCRYTPKRYIDGIDYICWNAQKFNSSVTRLCQDITDCVIKQIVESCNDEKEQETDPLNSSGMTLAQKILDLFDIEVK